MERDAYLEMAQTEERHWWFEGRRRILNSIVKSALNGVPDPEILEIGAGTGGNLGWLSRHGRVSAVEMNEEARNIAAGKSGIEVVLGALPDRMPTMHRSFDLVVLLDVLEHVEDDVEALKGIGPLLGHRGRLLLTVPAYPWLWSAHDVFLHHKRRYTKSSLQASLTSAGLRTERLTHFNSLLFPMAIRGAHVRTRRQAGADCWHAGAWQLDEQSSGKRLRRGALATCKS